VDHLERTAAEVEEEWRRYRALQARIASLEWLRRQRDMVEGRGSPEP
jgi:hypothetical protein